MDICEFKNSHFLISVDMYSRYLEIAHLSRMTSSIVIAKMKNLFARHGVPESVISDNGTQLTSANFVSSPWSGVFTTLRLVPTIRRGTEQLKERYAPPRKSSNKKMSSRCSLSIGQRLFLNSELARPSKPWVGGCERRYRPFLALCLLAPSTKPRCVRETASSKDAKRRTSAATMELSHCQCSAQKTPSLSNWMGRRGGSSRQQW